MSLKTIAALARWVRFAAIALCGAAASAQPTVNTNVVNTPTVRSADEPARNAFQIALCTIGWPPGCGNTPSQLAVPTGKRLVIEFVSGACLNTTDNDRIASARLSTVVGGSVASHVFVPMAAPGLEGSRVTGFSQPARIYADGDSNVSVIAGGLPTGNVGCVISLSGYLVKQ
jgi:hypothetical protein